MDKELKQQLKKIRRDLNDIKADVASNKENIGEMQGDLKAAKEERADLKSDVGVNKTNIQQGFKKAEKERVEIKKKIDKIYRMANEFNEEHQGSN